MSETIHPCVFRKKVIIFKVILTKNIKHITYITYITYITHSKINQ